MMEHLTTEEIINFVSASKIDGDFICLAAKVNGHIRHCEQCLNAVRSYQILYDEFRRMYVNGDFKTFTDDKKLQNKDF